MSKYKRMYAVESMNMNNTLNALKKHAKQCDSWKPTLDYFKKCVWIFENRLKPDNCDPKWMFKFELFKAFTSMGRKTISQLKDSISGVTLQNVHYDRDVGFSYASGKSTNIDMDHSIEPKNIILTLFGQHLFKNQDIQSGPPKKTNKKVSLIVISVDVKS
ncbi:hypothetical protein RF11_13668 [Thelohanellus kitauei]|uniref:Uncharacterized protein n=1 Tax=Thelohanellus kitauei TaxID=669202 RepID=A0A0C2JUD5_THEKT|nr:hypothetical protein RF11_13668 [Thelohanellus kitauei]